MGGFDTFHHSVTARDFLEAFEEIRLPRNNLDALVSFDKRIGNLVAPDLARSLPALLQTIKEVFAAFGILKERSHRSRAFFPDATAYVAAEVLARLFLLYPADSSYQLYMKEKGLVFAENLLRYLSLDNTFAYWKTYNDRQREKTIRQIAHIQSESYSSRDFEFLPPAVFRFRHNMKYMGEYGDDCMSVSKKARHGWHGCTKIIVTTCHEAIHHFQKQIVDALQDGRLLPSSLFYRQAQLFDNLRTDEGELIYLQPDEHWKAYRHHPKEKDARAIEKNLDFVAAALKAGTEDEAIATLRQRRMAVASVRAGGGLKTPAPP